MDALRTVTGEGVAGRAILLYDDACGLCHWLVRLVLKNDRVGRIVFAPLQSAVGEALVAAHSIPADVDSVVLVDGGGAWTRSEAVIRLAGNLGFPWGVMGAWRLLPLIWRDAWYDAVARRRARMAARFGLVCSLPTLPERERFLDRSLTHSTPGN
jgi:predicted DCC family thiol-disulfide oxidoreductase YuxK